MIKSNSSSIHTHRPPRVHRNALAEKNGWRTNPHQPHQPTPTAPTHTNLTSLSSGEVRKSGWDNWYSGYSRSRTVGSVPWKTIGAEWTYATQGSIVIDAVGWLHRVNELSSPLHMPTGHPKSHPAGHPTGHPTGDRRSVRVCAGWRRSTRSSRSTGSTTS